MNGYDVGADDYITKPFSLMVLIAKVNVLLRRIRHTEEEGQVLVSGAIKVQCREMKVYVNDREILLSKKELQLLLYFLKYPGQIISKEQILEAVWDIDGQFVDDNTVPVTISRLKKKVGKAEEQEYIKNVRGMGYIWTMDVLKKIRIQRTRIYLAGQELKGNIMVSTAIIAVFFLIMGFLGGAIILCFSFHSSFFGKCNLVLSCISAAI